jgi:hypothetical protein
MSCKPNVRAISDMSLCYVIVGRLMNGANAFRLVVIVYMKVNVMVELFSGIESHKCY